MGVSSQPDNLKLTFSNDVFHLEICSPDEESKTHLPDTIQHSDVPPLAWDL